MSGKDIAYVAPATNPCPVCGQCHRLMTDELAAAVLKLGGTPEMVALLQEESDDLAEAYGCPGHAPPDKDTKREYERQKKQRQRARRRAQEE